MASDGFAPLVRIWRGARVESLHHAALAVARMDGQLLLSVGDPSRPVFLRSTAKPFQAWPLASSGAAERFELTDAQLAVACGSHGGEPMHVRAVEGLLALGGHDGAALQCGPHPPMHRESAEQLIRDGLVPTPLHNNCSGQHAGMLLLARHLEASSSSYLAPDGPVQAAMRVAVARHCGLESAALETAVDGCSAPTFAAPLAALARGYAGLAAALGPEPGDPHLARIARAMTLRPEMVAGSGRLDSAIIQAGEGRVVAKLGAEGTYAVAALTPGGPLGLAIKVADGDTGRALAPLVLALLARLRALPEAALTNLAVSFSREIRNHRGLTVGRVDVSLPEHGK